MEYEEFAELLHERRCGSTDSINGVKIIRKKDPAYNSKLKKALDEYYIERLLEEGVCKVCNAKTSKFCFNCGTSYCSVQCQDLDWPVHQATCETALSQTLSEGSLGSVKDLEGTSPSPTTKSCKNKNENNHSPKYKFLKQPCKKDEPRDQNNDDHSMIRKVSGDQIEVNPRERNKTSPVCLTDAPLTENGNQKKRNGVESYEKSKGVEGIESDNGSQVTTSFAGRGVLADGKGPRMTARYETGQTLKVKCSWWDSDCLCWVIEVQNLERMENIMKSLKENCVGYYSAIPEKGKVFATTFNGEWYRVRILSTDVKIAYRCIDTGRRVYPKFLRVKKLPPDLLSPEAVAFPVEFQNPVLDKPDELSIKIVSVRPNGQYVVKVLEEIVPTRQDVSAVKEFEKEVKTTLVTGNEEEKTRRCVVDDLQIGFSGMFMLMQIQGDCMYGCLLPESVDDADHCYKKITSLYCMEGDRIEAKAGDLVMVANTDNVGQRGIVKSISSGRYEVRLIDYGCLVWTEKLYKLPESADDLMELGCKMTLKSVNRGSNGHSFEVNTSYPFDVVGKRSDGKWSCVLNDDSSDGITAEVIVEKLVESGSEAVVYIPYESGCRVVISAVNDDNAVYVRRVDGKWEERLENLHLEINRRTEQCDANFAKGLKKGDMVLCKFKEDNVWYRGKVLSRKGDVIPVLFVDYGNIQMSKVDDLKPLPEKVRREPFFARKVRLIGDKQSFTRRGKEYLVILVTETRELIMTYEGDISDGVILSEGDCFEINQFVYEALPGSLPNSPVKSTKLDPLAEKFLMPQLFPEGPMESFMILHVNKDDFMEGGTFWAADPVNDNLKYVVEELGTEISLHCSTCKDPYTPSVGELCFALFEDGWYRGLASRKEGELVEVFFADFGNRSLVDPKWIRKMVPKFFLIPPPAVKCVLHGFEKLSKDQCQSAYEFLYSEINNLTSVVIEKVEQKQCYVTFPDLSKLMG